MLRISIDIADDLLQALREQPHDVVQKIWVRAAVRYFQTRRLSLGQAARLAGIPRLVFLDVLMVYSVAAFDLSVEDASAVIVAARREWGMQQPGWPPDKPDAAFLGFCKQRGAYGG